MSNSEFLLSVNERGVFSDSGNVSFSNGADISATNDWHYITVCISLTTIKVSIGAAYNEATLDIPPYFAEV